MTPEQFVYWLQGYMEMANPSSLNMRETRIIKDHLALVFDKKTPEREEEKEPFAFKGIDFDSGKANLNSLPDANSHDLWDKKLCSNVNYSYDPNLIGSIWVTENTLPKEEKSSGIEKKNKKNQVKC